MPVALVIAVVIAMPAAAQEPPRPPAYLNAEACLRDHVDAAVRASVGAADAANFLLTYVCADTVEAAGRFERNTAALSRMKGMLSAVGQMTDENAAVAQDMAEVMEGGEDMPAAEVPTEPEEPSSAPRVMDLLAGVSVDPVTGELINTPTGGPSDFTSGMLGLQIGAADQLAGDARPTFLRTLAARLVMERRR